MGKNPYSPFTSHPSFNRMIFNWHFVRDAIEGESAIKFKNELYLPMPTSIQVSGMEQIQPKQYYSQFNESDEIKPLFEAFNPNYHPNPAYRSYITRARFPEITSFVLRGLIGLVIKEPVVYQLPSELEYLIERATVGGLSLDQLFVHNLYETLTTGKQINVVDVHGYDLFLAPYSAESNINWSYAYSAGSDHELLGLRLLEKKVSNFNSSEESSTSFSMFNSSMNSVHTVIDLVSDPDSYKIRYYSSDENGNFDLDRFNEVIPSYMGKTFSSIPAFVMGSLNNSFRQNPSPMISIARCAQHMYMKSADLSQSEFLSCSPMLVLSGVEKSESPEAIGSNVCLIFPNPQAKAEYTKTDTSALSHVRDHMKDLHEESINLGAQLLDIGEKPAETAETNRMRQGASTATLISTLNSVVNGMELALKKIAEMKGADGSQIKIVPNKEFLPMTISAAEIKEMVEAWTKGAISKQTLYKTFQNAGIAQENISFENEQNRISLESKLV